MYGAAGDVVTVTARVRRGAGMRLTFVSQAAEVTTRTLASDDETVELTMSIPPGSGYIRAEVRGTSSPNR